MALYRAVHQACAYITQSSLCDTSAGTILRASWVQVAASYGVRPTFAALSFLRWAAGPGRLTPTADCLSMLTSELRPLKRAEQSLLPEVCDDLFCSVQKKLVPTEVVGA